MVDFWKHTKNITSERRSDTGAALRRNSNLQSLSSAHTKPAFRLPSYDVLIQIARIFNVTTDFSYSVFERKQEL